MKAKILLALSLALVFGLIQFLRLSQSENTSHEDIIDSRIPVEKRTAAPRFILNDLRSRKINLDEYRGSVVLLVFWTTW